MNALITKIRTEHKKTTRKLNQRQGNTGQVDSKSQSHLADISRLSPAVKGTLSARSIKDSSITTQHRDYENLAGLGKANSPSPTMEQYRETEEIGAEGQNEIR